METWLGSNKSCEADKKTIYYLQTQRDKPMLMKEMATDTVRKQVETFLSKSKPPPGKLFDVGNRSHWQKLVEQTAGALETFPDGEDENVVFRSFVRLLKEEGYVKDARKQYFLSMAEEYRENYKRVTKDYKCISAYIKGAVLEKIASQILEKYLLVEDNAAFRLLIAICLLEPDVLTSSKVLLDAHKSCEESVPGGEMVKERAMDFAIAYGCGWQQKQSTVWLGSKEALTWMVKDAMQGISELFKRTLCFSLSDSLIHHACEIASSLPRPEDPLLVNSGEFVFIDCRKDGCTIRHFPPSSLQGHQSEKEYTSVLPTGTKFIFTLKGAAELIPPDDLAIIDLFWKGTHLSTVLRNGETAKLHNVKNLKVADKAAKSPGAPKELTFSDSNAQEAIVSAEYNASLAIKVKIDEDCYYVEGDQVATLKASAIEMEGLPILNSPGSEIDIDIKVKRNKPSKSRFTLLNGSRCIITSLDDGALIDLIEDETVLRNGNTATFSDITHMKVSDRVARSSGTLKELIFTDLSEKDAIIVSARDDTTEEIKVTIGKDWYELKNNETATLNASACEWDGSKIDISPTSNIVIKNESGNARIRITKAIALNSGDTWLLKILSKDAALNVWECTCGNVRCHDHHRLDSWNPEFPLSNFITFAVTHGIRFDETTFPFNQFRQGMYYPYLAKEGFEPTIGKSDEMPPWGSFRLRVVPVAYKHCTCGSEYTAGICSDSKCRKAFDERIMKIIAKDRLVLCGKQTGEQQTYSKCGKCGNLVPISSEDLAMEWQCSYQYKCKELLYDLIKSLDLRSELQKIRGMTAKRKLLRSERRDLIISGQACGKGHNVKELPWLCPVHSCGASNFGQRDVHTFMEDRINIVSLQDIIEMDEEGLGRTLEEIIGHRGYHPYQNEELLDGLRNPMHGSPYDREERS